MKNKLLSSLLVSAAAISNHAFATNGDTLIGLGAISRAMGGTGIAHFAGAETALKNPALLAKQQGLEVMFGGTFFAPDVEIVKSGTTDDLTASSDAKENMIPEVAIAHTLGDGWVIGVGMFGSAGMGTDWRDSAPMVNQGAGQLGLYSMRSNLLLMKFALPVAYGKDNWSVGIAPVLQYGALDLAFATSETNQVGQGSSYDFGMGFDLGFSYDIPDTGITLGLVYESAIGMTYDHQISNAATNFGLPGYTDNLEQPAQIGMGINWANDQMSVTFDIKTIKWADAKGYEDFGWENQTVYALGAEYLMGKLALRFGYNYGENPIAANPTSPAGDVINTFNHVMFPAITERHYTAGFGYAFSQHVELDMAFTYATSPDVTVSAINAGLGNLTVTNDQTSITAGIKYHF